ncbi:zinc finger MYND domain-containing protein [Sporobolomyces salmoneus]|uniref:zinc finger MYND domain-containing protein n=1 Tax=Sporobolomyces salmoneus TaxID=183962 RepID=UPI00317D76E0
MEMIAHRHDRAIHKLEQAVERNSSSACATLANLYSKGYQHSSSSPPPAVTTLGSPSNNSNSPPPPSVNVNGNRPRMPHRSTSWKCHHHHSSHRSPESLKAAELYLRGLEIELEKPIRGSGGGGGGKRGRKVKEESSSEEERAEGKYWSAQTTLDLIVGLTDAHRFGVLQPPSETSNPTDSFDSLWSRSSLVSSRILSHPTIAPLLSSLPSDPSLSFPTSRTPTPGNMIAPSLSRSTSTQSRRNQSVSRSYTHPATSIGLPQTRKLELTIAIHALYILALQAFSSPTPTPSASSPYLSAISGLPTPDSSPLLLDQALAPLSTTNSGSTREEGEGGGGGKLQATNLFNLILLLANPLENGPIGIKEGDELVSRAQRRLAGLKGEKVEGEEDWKLVKKRNKGKKRDEGNEELKVPDTAITLNGHGKDRSDDSSLTITPGNLGSSRRNSKFHFAPEEEEEEDTLESTPRKAPYPSPPVTPPPTNHHPVPKSLPPLTLETSSISPSSQNTSLRSPPLASPLQPRYHSRHSQSTTHLLSTSTSTPSTPRQRRDSFQSQSSAFTTFDPSSRLLRRVESSTSVCTVPPDFGATRVFSRLGDKGKGKTVDLESSSSHSLGSTLVGRGEIVGVSRHARTYRDGGEGETDRKVGKNWLSRFFSVSGLKPVRELPLSSSSTSRNGASEGNGGGVRDRLKEALKRDEEAVNSRENSVEYIMDWGDEDPPTEDEDDVHAREEEEEEETDQPVSSNPPSSPTESSSDPAQRTPISLDRPSTTTSTTPKDYPSNDPLERLKPPPKSNSSKTSLNSKRSFQLNDPTSSFSSSDSLLSPSNGSLSSSSRRRHRRHPSSSSSSTNTNNFLSPLSASSSQPVSTSSTKKPKPVSIDPLLLELERTSRVGVRTVCQNCWKKGLNYPACRSCGKCYCSRECRVGEGHACVNVNAA